MKILVLFFASIREAAQTQELELEMTGSTVGEALAELGERMPTLLPYLGQAHAAVNECYCDPETILHEGDTLALIPPVSGGR